MNPTAATPGARPRTGLLPAVAVLLALGAGSVRVEASEISADRSQGHAGSSHSCACGMDCGGTCCCARKSEKRPAPASRSETLPSPGTVPAGPSGPCLNSLPCGGGGGALPPSTPTLASSLDPAALAAAVPTPPAPGGAPLALPALPAGPSPADEPPGEPPRPA